MPETGTETPVVVIEAEYSLPDEETQRERTWRFEELDEDAARDKVASSYIPMDANIWRLDSRTEPFQSATPNAGD